MAPCGYRLAYLLRTPLLKSYSGRMVSRSGRRSGGFAALRFFFVGMTFPARRRAGTDDSNLVTTLGMRKRQADAGVTKGQLAESVPR